MNNIKFMWDKVGKIGILQPFILSSMKIPFVHDYLGSFK